MKDVGNLKNQLALHISNVKDYAAKMKKFARYVQRHPEKSGFLEQRANSMRLYAAGLKAARDELRMALDAPGANPDPDGERVIQIADNLLAVQH